MKLSYLSTAWLVLILAIAFGAALAAIQTSLGPKIEQNKINATYDEIPGLVGVTDQAAGKAVKVVEMVTADEKTAYKVFDGSGKHIGWVIRGVGQGFADKIEILIGMDASAERLTGMVVLDQKETPGLGDKIRTPGFQGQYAGLDTAKPVNVIKQGTAKKADNQIKAITGATVSSQSVTNIVNAAVKQFRGEVDSLEPKRGEATTKEAN